MSQSKSSDQTNSSWIILAVSGALLCVHLGLRFQNKKMDDGLDAITLGLMALALAPWMATLLSSLKFGGMEIEFKKVEDKVAAQGLEIDQLQFLVKNFLPRWELEHMNNLAAPKPFKVDFSNASPEFEGELRRLRAHKFIEHCSDMTIGEMFKSREVRDLHHHFRLTQLGREYLKHRETIEARAKAAS
jgi:hypothetical protein